jgi:hypothetical protein
MSSRKKGRCAIGIVSSFSFLPPLLEIATPRRTLSYRSTVNEICKDKGELVIYRRKRRKKNEQGEKREDRLNARTRLQTRSYDTSVCSIAFATSCGRRGPVYLPSSHFLASRRKKRIFDRLLYGNLCLTLLSPGWLNGRASDFYIEQGLCRERSEGCGFDPRVGLAFFCLFASPTITNYSELAFPLPAHRSGDESDCPKARLSHQCIPITFLPPFFLTFSVFFPSDVDPLPACPFQQTASPQSSQLSIRSLSTPREKQRERKGGKVLNFVFESTKGTTTSMLWYRQRKGERRRGQGKIPKRTPAPSSSTPSSTHEACGGNLRRRRGSCSGRRA